MSSHKTKELQRIFRDYEAAGLTMPAAVKDVADWAIRTGRWKAPASIEVSVCARELARAIREEYITDDQGKRVRVKHSVLTRRGDESLHLWHDMRRAERGHMELAFAQRRTQIIGDCHQLRTDVDYYNALQPEVEAIQLVLDFTDDVAELNAAIAAGKAPPKIVSEGDEPDAAPSSPTAGRERFRPPVVSRTEKTRAPAG